MGIVMLLNWDAFGWCCWGAHSPVSPASLSPWRGTPKSCSDPALSAFWLLITTRLKAWYSTVQMSPYCPRGARQAHRGQNSSVHNSLHQKPCRPVGGTLILWDYWVSDKLTTESWAEDQLSTAHAKCHHIQASHALQVKQGQRPKWTSIQCKNKVFQCWNTNILWSSLLHPPLLHVCEDQEKD